MEKTKPVFDSTHGRVKVAVWENTNRETGQVFHNTTIRSQYQENGEWKDTSSFSAFDLLNLSRCIADALGFVLKEAFGVGRDKKAA